MRRDKPPVESATGLLPDAPVPFGQRIASRTYVWAPPVGRRRKVDLDVCTPVLVGKNEWSCAYRLRGLPKPIDGASNGIDALQALELALVGLAAGLSQSPQFRAGQIEAWGVPIKRAAALSLPLPMFGLQLALENLGAALERLPGRDREHKRDRFHPLWRESLLSGMRMIGADLATLTAHLPGERAVPKRRRRPAVAGAKRRRTRVANR